MILCLLNARSAVQLVTGNVINILIKALKDENIENWEMRRNGFSSPLAIHG